MTNPSRPDPIDLIPLLTLEFLADPGHGWLQVEMEHMRCLGIAGDISACSYIGCDGRTAYLEEDCDAPLYIDACRKAGISVALREHHCDGDSFIRRLPVYAAHPRHIG
jgi:hypothetical protein